MYGLLVFEGGLPPGYVLDEMPPYEINAALSQIHLRHKESWEQTRMLCHIIAAVAGNKLKPTDIIKFPWDKKDEDTVIDAKDIERLKEKMKQYTNQNVI